VAVPGGMTPAERLPDERNTSGQVLGDQE